MWKGEFGGVENELVVGKKVNVYETVLIGKRAIWVDALLSASQFFLYLLGFAQACHWRHHGVHKAYDVDKLVGGQETHGVRLDIGRYSIDRAHALINECEGLSDISFSIA
jgi:hypothetical protein